jgi:hypothetical protein
MSPDDYGEDVIVAAFVSTRSPLAAWNCVGRCGMNAGP